MDDILKEGLPFESKVKLILVVVLFAMFIINHNLPSLSASLDYEYRNIVTVGLVALCVIFSIGNYFTESVVIGLCVFAIMSNIWDFSVFDVNPLRKQILVGSILILSFSVIVGKVSIYHLIKILNRQLGGN